MAGLVIAGGLVAYMLVKAVSYAFQWDALAALIFETDHALYMRQAERVLSGGPLYPDWQLAGPYSLAQMPELYPPPTVYLLLVPMSLLPDVLWWAVPLAVIAGVVWHWRPSLWGWVAILLCLAVPRTWTTIATGNPVIWATAFVALGTIWKWPAILVLLKPTLAPFALVGIRSRSWWIAVVALGLVSLVMLPGWLDYLVVLSNNVEGSPILYSLDQYPLVAIPIVAWLARQ